MQHIVNVEAAIYKDRKWLLIRRGEGEEHEAGVLSLVGGKVDDISVTENILEETLIREIDEEVGLKVKNLQYLYSTQFSAEHSVVDIIFVCEYASGQITITHPDEAEEAVWMGFDEIQNSSDIKEWTKNYISKARDAI